MRIAFKELLRRPSRFLTAGGALTLIVMLLLILGGLLDGLYLGATNALSAQTAGVFVFSKDSRDSLVRSRIDAATRAQIVAVPGVEHADGLGVLLIGATVPGRTETVDVAVFGYEEPNARVPAPPPPGQAWVDRSLEESGVKLGQTLGIGPQRVPVTVKGWVSNTSYELQAGVWVDPSTWREALAKSRPDAAVASGTFQAILVTVADGVDPEALARQIDARVPGVHALTKQEAILALPGVAQQSSVFTAIILVTFVVAGLVVALFFALLTLERVGLFGVLKAIGASSWTLAAGLTLQAVLIATGAFAVGGLLTLGLARIIPAEVPVLLVPRRAMITAIGLVVTALIGSAVSFRRIIRIDPATAVGGS